MTWQFVAASLEPDNRTRENLVFFLCMEPAKVLTMLDGLDEASPKEMQALTQAIRLVEADKRRIIVGKDRLQAMNKKIGERIALYPINYKDLQLDECEIVGTFPDGRYNQTALMSRERLNDALDLYKRKTGKPHFMANKTLNVVWLRVPDTETFSRMADQIMTSSLYTNPPVKCETASSGVASFLDGYRTLIWGMRGCWPRPCWRRWPWSSPWPSASASANAGPRWPCSRSWVSARTRSCSWSWARRCWSAAAAVCSVR